MKQRTVEIIADFLVQRPIGRLVGVRALGDPQHFSVSVEDRRDGRTHVFLTTDHLETWLQSFRQGQCLVPRWGLCDCCQELHGDHDLDGELFNLCLSCRSQV